MEKKTNGIEWGIYALICVLTLGGAFVLRVVISEAIRQSFED